MKTIPWLAILCTASAVWAADSSEQKAYASSAFQESFKDYKTALLQTPDNDELIAAKKELPAVTLEAMTVVGTTARHDLENAIADHARQWERTEWERTFSWKRGGLIATERFGSLTANLGIWPFLESEKEGTAILGSGRIQRLKVDVLHLHW